MNFAVALFSINLLFAFGWVFITEAQPVEELQTPQQEKDPYGTSMGLEILVTNSGFGLGAYYNRALNGSLSFMVEASLGAGKDERELKFFRFGTSYIPNKANYLVMLPVQVGLVQRLFKNNIEDNFRPFLQLTGGPTLGWEYPYFRDNNGNGTYDSDLGERTYDPIGGIFRGELRPGVGATIAFGAHFGISKRMTNGVRMGYTFTYFFEGVQLLEPVFQEAQHFFGTPTISLIFGKLL